MDYQRLAEENFMHGMNCAQAVFLAFQDRIGLDENTMLRISADLGGGMAGMRSVCGAVNAMFLVMGALYGSEDYTDHVEKSANYKTVRAMAEQFQDVYGSLKCGDLLATANVAAVPEPAQRSEEYYKTRPCVRYVGAIARLLQEKIAALDAVE